MPTTNPSPDDISPQEPHPIPPLDPPAPDAQEPSGPPPPGTQAGLTAGGYSYTIVDDAGAPGATAPPTLSGRLPRMPGWLLVAAAAVVPAVIAGVLVWLFAGGGGGDGTGRASSDVASILAAFSQSQTGTTTRYEGTTPPGFPGDVPAYPGAKVVSSILQLESADAGYLVVSDSGDGRAQIVTYYKEAFTADPWQVDAGQDGRESTLLRFSKIDDPNIEGLVLIGEAKGGGVTTVITSVQVTSGASDSQKEAFELPAARELPDGFPSEVPAYDGAVLFETAFQKQSGASQFVATYLTTDNGSAVLDFFRARLPDARLTVADGDASSSSLADAQAITFSDDAQSVTGGVTVGTFPEDDGYTQIDVQVSVAK